jgi:hypothetical protein
MIYFALTHPLLVLGQLLETLELQALDYLIHVGDYLGS